MTIVRHPRGLRVNGKLYLRDEYFAAERISLCEWVALITLLFGLALYVLLIVGGLIWLVRLWH